MISIFLGCLLVAAPAVISEVLFRNYDAAMGDRSFITAHSTYIEGFRVKSNILVLMYYPIFLFRRLCFAATITILVDYPRIQLSLIMVGTFTVHLLAYNNNNRDKTKYSFYSISATGSHSGADSCSIQRFTRSSYLQWPQL